MAGIHRITRDREARPEPRRYQTGERITEKYQLLRPLGEGGMGAVWAAHNLALDIHVAVKVIRTGLDAPDLSERLLREARHAARLDHPSIVRVLDFGYTREGDPFIAMELLDGESLGERLDRERRLDPAAAVRALLPIADALRAMHHKGMIHRDIKPENIFLASDDAGRVRPKLVDFGLARVASADAARLTGHGAVMGSPDYVSPEQALGEELDPRTDIWSLSVVLYEAIVGERPFEADNLLDLSKAILCEEPVPSVRRAAGDAALWEILARGLSKARGDRWPSMDALGKALAGWLVARGIEDDLPGTRLRSAWLGETSEPAGSARILRETAPLLLVRPASPSSPAAAPPVAPPPPVRAPIASSPAIEPERRFPGASTRPRVGGERVNPGQILDLPLSLGPADPPASPQPGAPIGRQRTAAWIALVILASAVLLLAVALLSR